MVVIAGSRVSTEFYEQNKETITTSDMAKHIIEMGKSKYERQKQVTLTPISEVFVEPILYKGEFLGYFLGQKFETN